MNYRKPLLGLALLGAAGLTLYPTSSQARVAAPAAIHLHARLVKGNFPIAATLSAASVRRNDAEKVTVTTVAKATINLRVVYPQSGGFHTHGTVSGTGAWTHSWQIHAQHPGVGNVVLEVIRGNAHRFYTVHFTVLASSGASPVAPAAPAPTVAPSPTPVPPTAPAQPTSTPTATPSPTATSTVAPTASTLNIKFQSLAFYPAVGNDSPVGAPQTSFSNTAQSIYAWAEFADWEGAHEVTFNWYDPSGNLYFTSADNSTDNGPADSISHIDVAGQPAGNLIGTWTMKLVVDGSVVSTQQFSITGTAAPTATAADNIDLQGVTFYAEMSSSGPVGEPQTSFPSSTDQIYAYADFSDWEGQHDVVFNWYDPDGNLYATSTDSSTDNGPATSYASMNVAGDDAESMPGQWTFTLVIDGKVADTEYFDITD